MDKQLWQQAESRLSMYEAGDKLFCNLRFAQEKQALEDTNAITVFALLAKLQAAASAEGHVITVNSVVNSSFVAWLMGATKVNPLAPHYYCPACGNVEFVGNGACPWDLPEKTCTCGASLLRDGHDIPVEGFANYAKTCSVEVSLRVSTAFYPVAEEILNGEFPNADWKGCFDLRIREDLDQLESRLGKRPLPPISQIATPENALALYRKKAEEYAFITNRLSEQEPVDFDLLMQLEGLCHCTGAWRDNGEHLVSSDTAHIRQLPAYRERIWKDLTTAFDGDTTGVLEIMETARMGKYYAEGMPEEVQVLFLAYDFPEWYPWFLSRVRYLCPKGHIVALLQQELLSCWCQTQE